MKRRIRKKTPQRRISTVWNINHGIYRWIEVAFSRENNSQSARRTHFARAEQVLRVFDNILSFDSSPFSRFLYFRYIYSDLSGNIGSAAFIGLVKV